MEFVEHLGQSTNLAVLASLAIAAILIYGVHSGDFANWWHELRSGN